MVAFAKQATVIVLLLGATLACSSTNKSAWFRVTDRGEESSFQVAWQTYEKEDVGPRVTLVSMVHLGDEAFFRAAQSELEASDVVFVEGVQGAKIIALIEKDYRELAKLLELKSQSDVMKKQPEWINADVTEADIQSSIVKIPMRLRMAIARLRRVVDKEADRLSDSHPNQDPETLKSIARRGTIRRQLADGLAADDNEDPVIIGFRNEQLISALGPELERRRDETLRVAICYGGGHSRGISSWLKNEGYRVSGKKWMEVYSIDSQETVLRDAPKSSANNESSPSLTPPATTLAPF